MQTPAPRYTPPLDPGFIPATLWTRAYAQACASTPGSRRVTLAISRPGGTCWHYTTQVLPHRPEHTIDNFRHIERLSKFLLWSWGGNTLHLSGAPEIAHQLQAHYRPQGIRDFDHQFFGKTCFLADFTIRTCDEKDLPTPSGLSRALGRHLDGCRIGFDLGGSDRKYAAVIDGEVVHSGEIKWSPYFEKDPAWHRAGIQDTLEQAARHLPRVDAIGGSSAGIYIDNEARVASLFRGISPEDFSQHIRRLFFDLKDAWGGIPLEVANDGDVTALAGAMSLNDNAVLGLSMGTSQAGGFIDPQGHITGWLNELAFAPVDYRASAPADEWSGDHGCGVQYFSQQAVGRLIPLAGIDLDDCPGLPEKLEAVQELMQRGDARAAAIYETIGTYLGYSMAHYADFYDYRNLLLLGRVTSGSGGDLIITRARQILQDEFPDLSEKIRLTTPDEKQKRHGQAVAAASLPEINAQ